ncbi:hypothetical protein [Endozoicomonas lisbonensis]|uniref:Uncharacterized protein n=1 Tax=Endozoicomonas lisbonensis TaxID=3120522 RepID=A0ABV2SCA0_9GAMM
MNVGQDSQSITRSLPSRLPVIPEEPVMTGVSGARSVCKAGVIFKYIPQKPLEYSNRQAAIVNYLDSDFNCIDPTIGEQLKRVPVWINEHKEPESTQKSVKEKYIKAMKAGFSFNTPKHGMPYVGIIHFCALSDGKCLKIEDSIKPAVEIMQQKGAKTLVIPLSKELLQKKFRETLVAVENAVSQMKYKPEEIVFINEVEGFCKSFDLWGMEKIVDINESVKLTETVTGDSVKLETSIALDDNVNLEIVAAKENEVRTIETTLKPTLEESKPADPPRKKRKKKKKKKSEDDGAKALPSEELKNESSGSSTREILQAQIQILSEDLKSGRIEKIDESFSAIIYFLESNKLKVSSKDLNYLVDSYQQLKHLNKKIGSMDKLKINSYSFLALTKSTLMENFEHCLNSISVKNSVDVIDTFIKMTGDVDKEFDFTNCRLDKLTPFMLQHSSLYSGQWIRDITRHDKISIKAKFELMTSLYANFKKDFDSGECFKNSKDKLEKEFEFFFKGFSYQNIRIQAELDSLKEKIDTDSKILTEQQAIRSGGEKLPLPESVINTIEGRLERSRSNYQLFNSYKESNSAMSLDVNRSKNLVSNKYDEKLNEWIEKKTSSLTVKDEPSTTKRKEDSTVRLESIVEKVKKQAVLKKPGKSEEKPPEDMYYEAFELFSKGYYRQSQEVYKKICKQHPDSIFYIHSKLGLMESHTRTPEFRADEEKLNDVFTSAVSVCSDFRNAVTQGEPIQTSSSDIQELYNTVTEYSDKLLTKYTDIMQEQLNTVDELTVLQLSSSSENRPDQLSDEVLQFTIDTTLSEHQKIYDLTELSQLALIHVRQALQYRKEWLKNLRLESASATTSKKSRKTNMSKPPDELMTDLDDRIKKLDLFKAKQHSASQAISALKESITQLH